jgi:membrane protein DedA with SNARE-associated domain
LVEWAFELILTILKTIGLPGLFALMVVESFGIPPLPSEIILPFAGVLLATGTPGFNWVSVVGAALAGGVVGAIIAYEVGRWGGRGVIQRWGRKLHLGEEDLARAERFFDRHGEVTVFVARLVPIARAYISYPAGAAQMPRVKFALFTAGGALPFTVVMVYLGTVLGNNYPVLVPYFNVLDVVVAVFLAGALLWYLIRRRSRPSAPSP